MGEVKLVARTLDLFELYAREGRPLSLTELSKGLDAPMSSTLALVRTLVAKGYLYETRRRAGYYPTRRLVGMGRRIDSADSIANLALPYMQRLRDQTQETVVLGKREDGRVLYLDVMESMQPIRYTAEVGAKRYLHANSLGKALLAALPDDVLQDLFLQMDWTALTNQTCASPTALMQDLVVCRRRGWAANISESDADLAAVAMAFQVAGEDYAMSVAGPTARMQAHWDGLVAALQQVMDTLRTDLRRHEGGA